LVVDLGPARARALLAWETGQTTPGAAGLAWLDRANRLAPADQNVRFSLAARLLQLGRFQAAKPLFADMARRFATPEGRTGLAACQLALGDLTDAAETIGEALSATEAGPALVQLARQLVARIRVPGWCGATLAGTLLTDTLPVDLYLAFDGQPFPVNASPDGTIILQDGWQNARSISVETDGGSLLGSPISPTKLWRLEGFVERQGQHLHGFAWHPASPNSAPVLRLLDSAGAILQTLIATALEPSVDGSTPLSRSRVIRHLAPPGTARLIGADDRDVLGSPLPADQPPRRRRPKTRVIAADPLTLPVDVIIPVYRGVEVTLDCIHSVLATVAAPHRILVIDDATPEPELAAALRALAEAGRIQLLRTAPPGCDGRGFPAAANTGLREAAGRHAILLNSDTLVPPGWHESLRAACCSAPSIGTATPLSNEASIFSYPKPGGGNPPPDLAETWRLAAAAAVANGRAAIDVPTAHGFCMFIHADCLAQTGLLDEASFAQGYGEENDFTERARRLGWRHVAAPGVFVAHRGGVSFGRAGLHLLRRNLAILDRRYPDYRRRVADFIEADPLAPARRALDAALWTATRSLGDPVLLITHGVGGGTARVVDERAAALAAQGFAPIVLSDTDGLCEVGRPGARFANLLFDLPRELPELITLLAQPRPVAAELHHLLGHDHSILDVLKALAVPYDVWIHDYAWFCARVSFVTGEGRFCGEADTATCEVCIARWDRRIEDPIAPGDLRRRSAADLRAARAVVVPSPDVAGRLARHVPGLQPQIRPWERDSPFALPGVRPGASPRHVAVVGAIGVDKGFDVLLDCARDAAARALNLRFTVIGYTVDDDALLATGRVFVTGEFKREEASELIRAQNANLALMPSIWPETWCYALSDIWAAGLSAAVFDIGTPAERVRASGQGWIVPLGLPPFRLNDLLLELG